MFNIDTLASLCGVSRRTVRFYIQRGFVDPPDGSGRGSYYTERHLEQIRRLLALSARGVPLAFIEKLPDGTLEARGMPSGAEEAIPPAKCAEEPASYFSSEPERWLRVSAASGVELNYKEGALRPEKARRLAKMIHEFVNKEAGVQ